MTGINALLMGLVLVTGVPGPRTTVENFNGLPTFMIDGHPHMSTSFETYVPSVKHFRQMAEAGATVYGFPTNAGEEPYWHSTPTWVGVDVWDFSELDESVAKILEADPDAYIMPRINVSEPEWWRELHPEELMVFDDGTTAFRKPYRLWPAKTSRTIASIASQRWRDDMSASLRRFIEHVQQAPYADRVFGYQIFSQATEEWYHYTTGRDQFSDYSPHMTRAFQEWLKRKYTTNDALSAAWGRAETFDAVVVPSRARRTAERDERAFRDPATEMDVIDFYACFNEIMPETIGLFCAVAKEASGGTKVVGAFYAYMFEFAGNPESGHLAVEKLLQSDHLDFIVVTASYGSRQLGTGGSILRSPHTSLKLHGKLWYEDNDNVSFLFPEVSKRMGDAEWERSKVVLAATDTAEESKWIYQRGAGFVLGNGVYQALFDLHGGYFDNPELLDAVAGIYRVFQESSAYDRTSCSEILVVADERSALYCTDRSPLLFQSLYAPPYRLIKCGAPYDSVYLNDLALVDMTPYRFVIVLNAYCVDEAQEDLLRTKVMTDGRTVLWIQAPGLFRPGALRPDGPAALTGIALERNRAAGLAGAQMKLAATDHPVVAELRARAIDTWGPDQPAAEPIDIADADAAVIATTPDGSAPMLVSKSFEDWTSVYSPTGDLPTDVFRALARWAGVHIYNDRNDTVYVSNSYLTVNADGAGDRTLHFPTRLDAYDAVSGETLATAATELSVPLRDKETRILRLDRKGASRAKPAAAAAQGETP